MIHSMRPAAAIGAGPGYGAIPVTGPTHRRLRSLAALVPAAIVTIGLFAVMGRLIQVREFDPPKKETRILGVVTPTFKEDIVLDDWHKPEPVRDVELPPRPPIQTVRGGDLGLPPVSLPGHAPDKIPLQVISMSAPPPVLERIPTPIRPPVPSYPSAARNVEGDCTVRFSLTARGLPFNVAATCTSPVFEREAARAVGKAEFLPQIRDGKAVESHNLIYPLEFRLQ